MGQRIEQGERMPFFRYDTPYSSQNSFRTLLAQNAPLVLVFFSNFGHPVTRDFVLRYAKTRGSLYSGSMAVVVRSHPDKLASSVHEHTLPYPLLCDADGVLYDYLDIPQKSGTLMSCSLEAWKILREARKQGYRPSKNAMQQMPLTLVIDAEGTVLFAHYGASLTDVPTDCEAMENLLDALELTDSRGDLYPEPYAEADAGHAYAGDDDAQEETEEYGGRYDAAYNAPRAAATPAAHPDEDAWQGSADDPAQHSRRVTDVNDTMPLGMAAPFTGTFGIPLRDIENAQKQAATPEDEADTTELPNHRKGDFGPARGYPRPVQTFDTSELERTMELGYFNDPYAEE